MDPKTTPPTDQMTNQDNAGFMTPPPTAPQSDQQQQDTTDQPGPASLSVADLAEGNIAPDDNHTVIADNTQSSSEHGRPKAKILASAALQKAILESFYDPTVGKEYKIDEERAKKLQTVGDIYNTISDIIK